MIRDGAAKEGNVIMVNGSGDVAMQDMSRMAAAFRGTKTG